MTDLSPYFAGVMEALGRPIAKAHRELVNRAGHFRRTKLGELAWVEPHQVLAHLAEHGPEPNEPHSPGASVWMGQQAMFEALKGHNVIHAMHRRGLGWIDFLQGTPGDGPPGFEHGGGITHIKAKRDHEHSLHKGNPDGTTTLSKLPELIAKGKIVATRGLGKVGI